MMKEKLFTCVGKLFQNFEDISILFAANIKKEDLDNAMIFSGTKSSPIIEPFKGNKMLHGFSDIVWVFDLSQYWILDYDWGLNTRHFDAMYNNSIRHNLFCDYLTNKPLSNIK